jgi:hypothetical protein
MPSHERVNKVSLDDLFPANSRLLLTGGGRDFLERLGVDAARQVILGVLSGENVRQQTEPLTRRRIAQLSGAMIALYKAGLEQVDQFGERLPEMALEQLTARKRDNASTWIANWAIGLTGKSVQNVLRSDVAARESYVADFDAAIRESARNCAEEFGYLDATLGFVRGQDGASVKFGWEDMLRLTTAIGSMTLTIRGSDKSMYGKLFERLVLGSVLTILGFDRVDHRSNTRVERVFWLSDARETREADATLLISPGKVVRFDIGFIGPGNSEISKDKLSRFAREIEIDSRPHSSKTIVLVDRLPATLRTTTLADQIDAEILQMSMKYWPKELANRLEARYGYRHELSSMPEHEVASYLESKLKTVAVQDFLAGVSLNQYVREAPSAYSAE